MFGDKKNQYKPSNCSGSKVWIKHFKIEILANVFMPLMQPRDNHYRDIFLAIRYMDEAENEPTVEPPSYHSYSVDNHWCGLH